MKIHSFIFNWRGQYEKAKYKEKQLKDIGLKVTVINSDDSIVSLEEDWIHIGDESYFTAQFLMALKLFEGDVFFHVQADASYEDWNRLVNDAKVYYDKYRWGIYAPNVDYTWYDSSRTDIAQITFDTHTNLRLIACPDCTCWFIHKDIINDFKARKVNMNDCKMGWGWDIILPGISYLKLRVVLRDYSHTIQHPRGTGYNTQQAEQEMYNLFQSLSPDLKTVFSYIKGDRRKLLSIGNRNV